MKYEYLLMTWGGFYNQENKDRHGLEPGYHYFDSEEERENYLRKLQRIEKRLNAKYLASMKSEGFNVREPVILNRVSSYKGREVHTTYESMPGTSYSIAAYLLENKWYPGHHDYPFGEDFDYESPSFKVVQEWITGQFDAKESEF